MRQRLFVRRWTGADITGLPASQAQALIAEAQEARRIDVDAMAEAMRTALADAFGRR